MSTRAAASRAGRALQVCLLCLFDFVLTFLQRGLRSLKQDARSGKAHKPKTIERSVEAKPASTPSAHKDAAAPSTPKVIVTKVSTNGGSSAGAGAAAGPQTIKVCILPFAVLPRPWTHHRRCKVLPLRRFHPAVDSGSQGTLLLLDDIPLIIIACPHHLYSVSARRPALSYLQRLAARSGLLRMQHATTSSGAPSRRTCRQSHRYVLHVVWSCLHSNVLCRCWTCLPERRRISYMCRSLTRISRLAT